MEKSKTKRYKRFEFKKFKSFFGFKTFYNIFYLHKYLKNIVVCNIIYEVI